MLLDPDIVFVMQSQQVLDLPVTLLKEKVKQKRTRESIVSAPKTVTSGNKIIINYQSIFDTSSKREIGRKFLGSVLAAFLNIDFNLAILHSSGKVDNFIGKSIIFLKGKANT